MTELKIMSSLQKAPLSMKQSRRMHCFYASENYALRGRRPKRQTPSRALGLAYMLLSKGDINRHILLELVLFWSNYSKLHLIRRVLDHVSVAPCPFLPSLS